MRREIFIARVGDIERGKRDKREGIRDRKSETGSWRERKGCRDRDSIRDRERLEEREIFIARAGDRESRRQRKSETGCSREREGVGGRVRGRKKVLRRELEAEMQGGECG